MENRLPLGISLRCGRDGVRRITLFPTIDKRKTGTNLRRIMDKRGLTVKDVQQYLGLGSVRPVGCEKEAGSIGRKTEYSSH